jgi:DNA mismatch repair protein MutS
MMRQYFEIKKEHPSEILFFRMGDFYEMFFEDAEKASRILDIALTSRQNDIPMCGIPFHAAESYIARLIKAGERIAICEQLEKTPSSGTVVKREVVRVITPGTVIESNLLPSDDNNFLAALVTDGERAGMAFVDVSTGDFFITSMEREVNRVRSELARYHPGELVLREEEDGPGSLKENIEEMGIPIHRINDWLYDQDYMETLIRETFGLTSIRGLGLEEEIEIVTAGAVLQYVRDTQRQAIDYLRLPRRTATGERMHLDEATVENLELTRNLQDGSRARTLFSVLNHTRTPMGRRFLERIILEPLIVPGEIERRLDVVQYFHQYHDLADRIRDELSNVRDIERLLSRFRLSRILPRNFLALAGSLTSAMEVRSELMEQPSLALSELAGHVHDLSALAEEIFAAVDDEPALTPEQGRVIRTGYMEELDRLYELKSSSRQWVLEYQEEEKKRLDIPTLKVKYNRVLGYYIEISKGQASKAPEEYLRKQTLVGSERYTTEKLQDFEREILSSSDRIVEIENRELERLRDRVLESQKELQESASALAEIDTFLSLAMAALHYNYVRPLLRDDTTLIIEEGRHPVVERFHTSEVFIPNDVRLDDRESRIKIITGPNMSGKSTYIRMAALIQLMIQIGSFVPAARVEAGLADRVFARVGASDNIARGESTFLVEMNETAAILNNATERSLIIMDEVGRGTSTYDGLSIAWAVVEYILRYLGSRTLFATHYHELTDLGRKDGIENYTVLVKESVQGVEFLHRVARGTADRSYGIHVARLAGIPRQIITRAEKILGRLEKEGAGRRKDPPGPEDVRSEEQLEIFNAANHRLIQSLKSIDIDSLKPIDAINELHRLRSMIDAGEEF